MNKSFFSRILFTNRGLLFQVHVSWAGLFSRIEVSFHEYRSLFVKRPLYLSWEIFSVVRVEMRHKDLVMWNDEWKEIFVYAKRPCYLWSRKETLLCGTRKESLLCGTRQPCWRLYVEHDSHVGVYMQNAQDTHCETRIECIVKHTTNALCNTQKNSVKHT